MITIVHKSLLPTITTDHQQLTERRQLPSPPSTIKSSITSKMSSDSDYVMSSNQRANRLTPSHGRVQQQQQQTTKQATATAFVQESSPVLPKPATVTRSSPFQRPGTGMIIPSGGASKLSTNTSMQSSQKLAPPSAMFSLMERSKNAQEPDLGVQTARVSSNIRVGTSSENEEDRTDGSGNGSGLSTTTNSVQTDMEKLDLVAFIRSHLIRGKKSFRYNITQLEQLTQMAVDSFAEQPMLVETFGPINVCGDVHGQYSDLLRIFHACGPPHKKRYLFLGDFVDRGQHSLEVISLLVACKIQWPEHIFLLRGNHELPHINRVYGFFDELMRRFGALRGEQLWFRFNDVFSYMPLAATIGGKILCMHGGISPHLKSLDDIRKLQRPIPVNTGEAFTDPGLAQDIMWADPSPNHKIQGFIPNSFRNCSVMFGDEALIVKLRLLQIDKIIRAHQVAQYGYSTFCDGKLITVFSAPRYHPDMNNWAAVAHVDADLKITHTLLKPREFDDKKAAETDCNPAGSTIQRSC